MPMEMDSLSFVMRDLRNMGYTLDFNLQEACLVCPHHSTVLPPDQFFLDAVYRFEGLSDPGDEAILMAISAPFYGVKGLLINGFGIYSEVTAETLAASLRYHR